MKPLNLRIWAAALATLLAIALLASCGGGVGSGGTGITASTVTGGIGGFGSLIVDGQRIDDTQATLEFESEPGNPNKVGVDNTTTALGQQAVIDADASASIATRIRIVPELIGRVDAVDVTNNRLVVAGQNLRLNFDGTQGATTVLDGLDSLAELAVGDRLEIHGMPRRDAGTGERFVQATRLEVANADANFVRVSGVVEALDAGAATLRVGTLTVNFGAARMLPAAATLGNGKRVVVWSSSAVQAGVLVAQVIAVPSSNFAGKALRVGAIVADCSNAGACAASFSVGGIAADASTANFANGVAANLRNGVFVRAVGVVDGASGVFKISSLSYRTPTEPDITLYGVISSYVSDKNFLVRGVPVTTNSATARAGSCTFAAGQAVQITGTSKGSALLAGDITCLSSLEGLTGQLQGIASNVNTASQTLRVNGLLVNTPVSFAQASVSATGSATATITNGAYLEIQGRVTGGVLVAKSIDIAPAPSGSQFDTKGTVVLVSAGRLRVNGLVMQFNTSVVTGGTLATGRKIKARFTDAGGGNLQAVAIVLL